MFRKSLSSVFGNFSYTRNMSSNGRTNNLLKRKGRTPEKIQRFKSIFSKSGKSSSKDNLESKVKSKNFLMEPSTYFSKRRKMSTISKEIIKSDEDDILKSRTVHPEIDDSGTKLQTKNIEHEKISSLADILVAIDCEMVECFTIKNSLARCSIVNYRGDILLDLYIQQTAPVIDYRTRHSGITERLLQHNSCVSFTTAQQKVKNIIDGKLLLGHSIYNDFKVLNIRHPRKLTIDISSNHVQEMLKPLSISASGLSLKSLSKTYLKRQIQTYSHCSIEDSVATLDLFKLIEKNWVQDNKDLVGSVLSNSNNNSETFFADKFWPDEIKNE